MVANDSLRATIDVIAQKLVFTRKPAGTFSGTALNTQPIVSAVDDNGLVDLDFTDTVSVSTNGSGTLLHNRVIAIDGVATFTNLTYSTATDDERHLESQQTQNLKVLGYFPAQTCRAERDYKEDIQTLQKGNWEIGLHTDPQSVDDLSLIHI